MEENHFNDTYKEKDSKSSGLKEEKSILLESINKESAEKAIRMLDEYISQYPADDEAYTIRGMKYWSLSRRKEAINDYHRAIELNPESRAKSALEIAKSILDFYNKDLYNP